MELLIDKIKANIQTIVESKFNLTSVKFTVEKPETWQFGQYSTNVAMIIAKEVGKNPLDVAKEIVYELEEKEYKFNFDGVDYPIFEKIQAVAPGFINFYIALPWLMSRLYEIWDTKDAFGKTNVGQHKKVLIEFSNPNPNKPLHIGHSRNNFLGSSLANIYAFLGYDVIRTNYANDWGTHICKSMLMYQKHGGNADPDTKPDHFVGRFYQIYERESEKDPKLAEELAQMFIKLEAGDPEVTALWKKITDWVYQGWTKTYDNENVTFDTWQYQSNYTKVGKNMVDLAITKGVASKDETGAVIAHLQEKYGIPDKVLLRSNGTSLYVTQDLQLAYDSFKKYNLEERLYVVDNRQSEYFRQLFKILEILGFEHVRGLRHVSYGFISLPEGPMSSRKGTEIRADDVFAKLVELEQAELGEKVKKLEETAKTIALAAYRYGMLKVDPAQDIIFEYDKVTKFDGNTGPYLLYTYARANSIVEKGGVPKTNPINFAALDLEVSDVEKDLLSTIYRLEEVVLRSVEKLSPSELSTFAYLLCQKFNSLYAKVPILTTEDPVLRDFRLVLIACTAQIIKSSLALLGISVVEKM